MTESADLVEIRVLNLPVALQQQAAEHHDALVREFSLIKASTSSNEIPQRLFALIDEVQERFREFGDAPRAALANAIEQGIPALDITYVLPAAAGDILERLGALLREADEYCRAGRHLVTLASPPLVAAYRDWFISEFAAQMKGAAPTPWKTPSEVFTSHPVWRTSFAGDDVTVEVEGELDLATAPGLRDHLNALHTSGVRSFLLDTSGVTFIDSVGLSVILALYRRCREEDGNVTIVAPSRVMQRTLEVAGLTDVLDVSA